MRPAIVIHPALEELSATAAGHVVRLAVQAMAERGRSGTLCQRSPVLFLMQIAIGITKLNTLLSGIAVLTFARNFSVTGCLK